jgi:hypothetical protein
VKQPTAISDQAIIRYLLNELSEEDEARFEEAYLEDGDLFEQVLALEEELIEDYVKGELSGPERQLFERHYLASEKRRARIETARHLVQACSLQSTVESASKNRGSWFSSIYSWLGLLEKRYLVLGSSVTAATLLILTLSFGIELLRLRERLAAAGEERAGLERRATEAERQLAAERQLLAEERKRGSALREELENVAGRLDRLEQGIDGSQASKNRVVFLALAPGVRDIKGQVKGVISVDTTFVELRVTMERQEKQPPYRAAVTTVDGNREIWRGEARKFRQTISDQIVAVRVPADRFRAIETEDFMLTLSAMKDGGKDLEELEICYFQVIASR